MYIHSKQAALREYESLDKSMRYGNGDGQWAMAMVEYKRRYWQVMARANDGQGQMMARANDGKGK